MQLSLLFEKKNPLSKLTLILTFFILKRKHSDCYEVQHLDGKDLSRTGNSGIHLIRHPVTSAAVPVVCDFQHDEGGWTVIQRRGQYGNPIDEFNK